MIDRATWLSWTEGLDDEAARNALVMLVALGVAESLPERATPFRHRRPRWRRLHDGLAFGARPELSPAARHPVAGAGAARRRPARLGGRRRRPARGLAAPPPVAVAAADLHPRPAARAVRRGAGGAGGGPEPVPAEPAPADPGRGRPRRHRRPGRARARCTRRPPRWSAPASSPTRSWSWRKPTGSGRSPWPRPRASGRRRRPAWSALAAGDEASARRVGRPDRVGDVAHQRRSTWR